MGTVYADAVGISTMIIYGTPLYRIATDIAIGLRTHVVVELKDMMQTKWHHVVNAGLAASQHHAEKETLPRSLSVREGSR